MRQWLACAQVRLLCLARVPFSDADPMHLKLLRSLYANLTGGLQGWRRLGRASPAAAA